jgi:hypothetical protein
VTDPTPPEDRRGLAPSGLGRAAAAIGCTEGQAYTAVLAVVLAFCVVLFGIPSRTIATAANAPRPSPTTTTATTLPPGTLPPLTPPPLATTIAPMPTPTVSVPTGQPSGPPTAAGDPCEGDALVQAGRQIAEQLNGASGGSITGETLVIALGVAAGCDTTDPVGILLSLLTEAGRALPDLGLPPLPIPPIEIPPLLAPITGALAAPICMQATTFIPLLLLLAPGYPEPIQTLMLTVALQTFGLCGALGG